MRYCFGVYYNCWLVACWFVVDCIACCLGFAVGFGGVCFGFVFADVAVLGAYL